MTLLGAVGLGRELEVIFVHVGPAFHNNFLQCPVFSITMMKLCVIILVCSFSASYAGKKISLVSLLVIANLTALTDFHCTDLYFMACLNFALTLNFPKL